MNNPFQTWPFVLLPVMAAVFVISNQVESWAQSIPSACTSDAFGNCLRIVSKSSVFGDDDVGRAMDICEGHSRSSSAMLTSNPPQAAPREYDRGWEACYKVRSRWNESKAAQKERERLEQVRRDLEFVEHVAKEGAGR